MSDFKSIDEILKSEKSLSRINDLAEEFKVVSDFHLVFPTLEKVATPVKIVKYVLYLKVENSVWRSELNFRQKQIIDRINNHFGQTLVKSVKFIS